MCFIMTTLFQSSSSLLSLERTSNSKQLCTCSCLIIFLPKKLLNLLQVLNNFFRENKNPRPVTLNPEQNRLNKLESPNNREMLGSPGVHTSCDFLNQRLMIFIRRLATFFELEKILNLLFCLLIHPQVENFTLSSNP